MGGTANSWRREEDYSYSRERDQVMTQEQAMRVGNSERDRYIDHLANMVSEGYLPQSVFEVRRDRALEAVFKSDLTELVNDLPAVPYPPSPPEKRRIRVMYQVGGNNVKFSPVKWAVSSGTSIAGTVLVGPLFAAVYHGYDNAPWKGGLPFLLTFVGVLLAALSVIFFAPDHSEMVVDE
jgi:hypothetical protein